jgi:hypothetical protein
VRACPALLVLLASACSPSKTAFQLGVPGTSVEMTVARVTPRGGYLDLELQGQDFSLRSFAPASELCQRVAERGAAIQFHAGSPYGTLVRGADRCDANGIASLREWRNRRPRETSELVPSGQATYRLVYQDEELSFLRGVFPLVGLLGFSGMGDTVAVVPHTPECRRAIESTTSTVEYFHAGRNVLTLSSREGRCPIEALLRPLAAGDVQP